MQRVCSCLRRASSGGISDSALFSRVRVRVGVRVGVRVRIRVGVNSTYYTELDLPMLRLTIVGWYLSTPKSLI